MPQRIIVFLEYEILSQSTYWFISSILSAANYRKKCLPGLVSLPDQCPSPRAVFCQASVWISSVFLISQRMVQASLIFEMMKVSVGWHRWVQQGGRNLRIVCFSVDTVVNLGVILWLLQLSTQITFVCPCKSGWNARGSKKNLENKAWSIQHLGLVL
jgi:hypothetical protein